MKAHTNWDYKPYYPLDRINRYYSPYICQIIPKEDSCYFAFIDNGKKADSKYKVFLKERYYREFCSFDIDDFSFTFTNLKNNTDYEFYIQRDEDVKSEIRLFRTGTVIGTIVNYLHKDDPYYSFSGRYLCSPSLVKLPSGKLISSMDVFEGNNCQNLTLLFESNDNGKTWSYLNELFPCFWGQLFYENDRLYMLSASTEYGDILVGYSTDEGKTWSEPSIIFRGCNHCNDRGLHRAPMKLLKCNGRLWTDVEYGAWSKKEFNNAILSAPIDSDFSNPEVWSMSEFFMYNDFKKEMVDNPIVQKLQGAIEGNCVFDNGNIYDFLRFDNGICLVLRLEDNDPDGRLVFDHFVNMEINASKFDIVYDEVSQTYYSICSRRLKDYVTIRNVLSLYKSKDLNNWSLVCNLIDKRDEDPSFAGFQYVSFSIDGDDILYLSRTAYNNPHNFHDSNYQTFHTIKDFRKIGG